MALGNGPCGAPDEGLCWGGINVDRVIEFTEPADLLGQNVTQVDFAYRSVPDAWLTPALTARLSIDPQREASARAVLVKTNKGWRLETVDWAP